MEILRKIITQLDPTLYYTSAQTNQNFLSANT